MKVKNYMNEKEYEEFLCELSYLEWLRESYKEPTEEELDAMEHEFRVTKENIYLYLHSKNNPEYIKPKQGA